MKRGEPGIGARVRGRASAPEQTKIEGRLEREAFDPPTPRVLFECAQMAGVSFAKRRFFFFHARSSEFDDCDFTRTQFGAGSLALDDATIYRDCRFDDCKFEDVLPDLARFERCSFENVRIRGWRPFCAQFVDCDFAGATIEATTFAGRPYPPCANSVERSSNDFSGNDFSTSRLRDCAFIGGIDPTGQKFPPDVLVVQGIAERLRDLAAKRDAACGEERRWLGVAVTVVEGACEDQDDAILVPDILDDLPAAVRAAAWATLDAARG